MKALVMGALALMLSACTNVTTMRIDVDWEGKSARINSGKDVSFKSFRFTVDPRTGQRTMEVTGYTSNANVDVISAQSARETAIAAGAIQAIEAGIKIGAKAALPVP